MYTNMCIWDWYLECVQSSNHPLRSVCLSVMYMYTYLYLQVSFAKEPYKRDVILHICMYKERYVYVHIFIHTYIYMGLAVGICAK